MKKIRINVIVMLITISYFVLMEPRYFYYIKTLKTIWYGMIGGVDIILIVAHIRYKFKLSIITKLVIIYHAYLALITFAHKGDIRTAVIDSAIFIGLCLCTEIGIQYNAARTIRSLLAVLEAEVFINIITIILFPRGLYSTAYFTNNYFLGYDNQNINILLPMLVIAIICAEYGDSVDRLNLILVTAMTAFTVIFFWSGASLVVIAIIMGIYFSGAYKIHWLFNFRNYLICNFVFFYLFVILEIPEYFSRIVVVLLGKSTTFSGRIYFWRRTIELIRKNPLLGYGVEFENERVIKYALSRHYHISSRYNIYVGLHAHNRYLETMYRGGFILTILYLLCLYLVVKNLMKNKKQICAAILALGLFAYLTGMLTEFYRLSYLFFPMMTLSMYVKTIETSFEQYRKRTTLIQLRKVRIIL